LRGKLFAYLGEGLDVSPDEGHLGSIVEVPVSEGPTDPTRGPSD